MFNLKETLEIHSETINDVKEALRKNDTASAAEVINGSLAKVSNCPLNIAITGQSGSGKSTFINAFRGIEQWDDKAAPNDCIETTAEVKDYPHPNFPNVVLWDLPGVGTPKFPAETYLTDVNFERFDFFIIISESRFKESDVNLATEIQKMGRKFYFVRSKIDSDLYNVKSTQKNFDEEKTLAKIKNNCVQGLQNKGFKSPQVFLLSSLKLNLYDFQDLHNILEKELPEHKRLALLMAMPNINPEVIQKKKEAFRKQIFLTSAASAFVAAVPVPALSIAVDIAALEIAVTQYVLGFGLDLPSLKKLANTTDVPLEDLMAVIKSPLAATKISKDLILNVLNHLSCTALLMAAEEGCRFIPVLGIPVAMSISFGTTYRTLNFFLNSLADDAQSVFTKVMSLDTSL